MFSGPLECLCHSSERTECRPFSFPSRARMPKPTLIKLKTKPITLRKLSTGMTITTAFSSDGVTTRKAGLMKMLALMNVQTWDCVSKMFLEIGRHLSGRIVSDDSLQYLPITSSLELRFILNNLSLMCRYRDLYHYRNLYMTPKTARSRFGAGEDRRPLLPPLRHHPAGSPSLAPHPPSQEQRIPGREGQVSTPSVHSRRKVNRPLLRD